MQEDYLGDVMHAALRPYVTTGIALVGASVIAVTPITPSTPPEIRVASPAVQLTQSGFPYIDLIQHAITNATILTQVYQAEPFPIIRALLGNEVTAPTDILSALGLVGYSAVSWVVGGVVGGTEALALTILYLILAPPDTPFVERLIEEARIILSIPAFVADGALNGSSLPGYLFPWDLPGILNPGDLGVPLGLGKGAPPMDVPPFPGLIGSLIALDQAIGAAISSIFHPASTPLAPASEPPKPAATTLTLSTTPLGNNGSTPAGSAPKSGSANIASQAQPQPGSTTAGPADGTNGPAKTGADATSQAEHKLDAAAIATINPDEGGLATSKPTPHELGGAANATDRLAQARSNSSTQGQHGLDTATSSLTTASTGTANSTKVKPGQEDRNGAPSGSDVVNAAKPVSDHVGSTSSTTDGDSKKPKTSTSTNRG